MELFSASLRDIVEGGLACRANFKAVYISYVSSAEKKLPHLLLCSFFRWLQFRSKVKDGSKFLQTRVVHGNVAVVNLPRKRVFLPPTKSLLLDSICGSVTH